MSKMLHWLSAVVADLTCAAPPRGVPADRDWMPSTIAGADPSSLHFLAMVDLYAGWYRERHGRDASASRAIKAPGIKAGIKE